MTLEVKFTPSDGSPEKCTYVRPRHPHTWVDYGNPARTILIFCFDTGNGAVYEAPGIPNPNDPVSHSEMDIIGKVTRGHEVEVPGEIMTAMSELGHLTVRRATEDD